MLRPVTGPDIQWKAAAFARWHEPDDARVSSPVQAAREEAERLAKPAPPNSDWWKTAEGTAGMRARRS
jgi:hypothetical protein